MAIRIYRALAEHAKREAYPEAVEAAHADFATIRRTLGAGGRADEDLPSTREAT
ncbi:hypothetical protein [Streptomyces sp. NPDC049915]|uniref:hypothetical protein n=1 Tax=Streptomyces sp. NPDC049915 TaxID=3155510 RepID=UPI00343B7EA3